MHRGVVFALVLLGPALGAGTAGGPTSAPEADGSLTLDPAGREAPARGAADQAAALENLARAYALRGDWARAAAALGRLNEVAPRRIESDPDLCWLFAEAADRTLPRLRAAGALLRCADLFPGDVRRDETLVRAARALASSGETHAALTLIGESLQNAGETELAIEARIARAETLERAGLPDEARCEYERVWREATEQRVAERALDRIVDLTVEKEGRTAALLLLAAKIRDDERLADNLARDRFVRLVEGQPADIAGDLAQAAFLVELARRAGAGSSVPPEIQLAAARLREDWGAFAAAASRYSALTDSDGAVGLLARAGRVRCQPREPSGESADDDPERIAALEREQAWPALSRAVQVAAADAGLDGATRLRGARAALMLGDDSTARALLGSAEVSGRSTALLRADAAALAGDWDSACADYAAAGGADLWDAEQEWLETRLAVCEVRRGEREAARRRLAELLSRGAGEPARFAAERLLSETASPLSASGAARPAAGRRR